jgi:hypothetical protein
MAELRGGTTIGGFTALHSGLKEAYLGGNLTINGMSVIKAGLIVGNNDFVAYSGGPTQVNTDFYVNGPTEINDDTWVSGILYSGTSKIAQSGKLFYSGQDTDSRYVNHTDAYITADTAGSTTDASGNPQYPRLVVKNSGATTPDWLRVAGTGFGILPYSNGNSYIGTSSWRFKEIHGVTIFENGTQLTSKFLGINAKAVDSDKLDGISSESFMRSDADDTFTGKLSVGSTSQRDSGIYGTYDSYKIGHVWSMGTAYSIPADGSTFGNLYGMAYKYTNNTTGGTMAGGHQIVFTNAGTPGAAIGLNGGIWTKGKIEAGSNIETTGTVVINKANGHIFLQEGGASKWHMESVSGAFNLVQTNVAERLSINTSGTVTIGSSLSAGSVTSRGFDFFLGNGDQSSRGNSGSSRALVKTGSSTASTLTINYSSDFAGGTVIDSTLDIKGETQIWGSGGAILDLIGTDHGYIEFFPMGTAAGRKAWLGFGSAGSTRMTIQNTAGGDLELAATGGKVTTGGYELFHKNNITYGTSGSPTGGTDGNVYIQY